MLGMSAEAQTVDIHKTDGTTVSYPASEVNYIGFTAKQQGGEEPSTPGTAPAGVVAVDLGLPSGTKWANMNVGASKPEDYGLYFAWGETVGYGSDTNDGHSFDWASYNWCKDSWNTMTKYCTDSSYGTVDDKAVLDQLAGQGRRGDMLRNAPLAIVVCGDMTKALEGKGQEYWIQDTSAATENLLLAAHAMGLGAVWTGQYPMDDRYKQTQQALGLPETVVPLCIVIIGHPAEQPTPKDKWNPSNVSYNKFGNQVTQ